ncbi:MAG: extracellular solute-binding protein [Lachnospiraceae bacterium]|nr:extracellular solute-binding protein [Lachnospiraceae bacterium]
MKRNWNDRSGEPMKNNRKYAYRLCAALACVLSLAAGSGALAEAAKLSYYTPSYGYDTYIGIEILEKVMGEVPEITVIPTCSAEEQYYATLKTLLATGKGPDLFFVQAEYAGFNGINELAEAGYLADLSDLETVKGLQKEMPGSLLQHEGKIYSVSVGEQLFGVRYHKKMFEECRLDVPKNWDEFLDCCQTLQEAGHTPFLLFTHTALYQIAANQLYRDNPDYGNQLLSGAVKFTDEGTWDKVLEQYFEVYEKGYVQETPVTMSMVEMMDQFSAGNCAMMQVTLRSETVPEEDEEEYGYFVIPGNTEGTSPYYMMGQVGGMAMYAKTEYPEESSKVLDRFIGEMGFGKTENLTKFYPELEQALNEVRVVHPCNYDWKNEVETIVQKKINEYLMKGKLSIDDITAAMQEEFDRRS